MTGGDVDGAAGGVVDGDVGGRFAVKVDGAGVVEELLLLLVGAVAAALEVAGELVEWDHLCWLAGLSLARIFSREFLVRYFSRHDMVEIVEK